MTASSADNCAISRLSSRDEGFSQTLSDLIAWDMVSDNDVEDAVIAILRQVKAQGDQALIDLTNRFDRRQVAEIGQLIIGQEQLQQALESIDIETRTALETAAERIRDYHSHQEQPSWQYREADGTVLGQHLCAGRQSQLSLIGIDELHSGTGCRSG
jgi:histidinol dehydrogenase